MFNTITEFFLNTYFMFDAVIGKITGDRQTLFDKLYSIFLLPEDKRTELFNETQAEIVSEMETYSDYAQICRIQKFSELTEFECVPTEFNEMISIKGGALKKIKQLGFDEYTEGTEAAVCKFLNDTANMGIVSSLCMLGFLQVEGIFITKNEKLGVKNLNKAALWNSIEGIILALSYDESNRQNNLDRLYTVTQGTLYDGFSSMVKDAYSLNEANLVSENKLLKKAFGMGILKPDVYVPQYARFVSSKILDFKDKERVLLSGHKEVIFETADLPLKLTCGELPFNAQALEELPIVRKKEHGKICSIESVTDMRNDSSYHPLCVCGDSEYLLGLYASAISKAFPLAHIEKIEISDLDNYDFEPTKNNIFVRSCDEDRQNVFLLVCKGDIKDIAINAVKNFLQSDKRKKTRLMHPSAVIDLSSVLPICICDKQNAKALKTYCDVVTLASISEAEKVSMLGFIVQEKIKKYRLDDLQINSSAQSILTTYSIDKAESLLDRVVRYNRDRASITVTAEMLKDVSGGDVGAKYKYGFGGAENENK